MSRRGFTTLVVAAALALPVGAAADDSLEELIEHAGEGEFHGVGIVMCSWGADSAAATYEVDRFSGMSMVHGPDRDLMLSGSLVAVGSDSEWYALEVAEWSSWSLSDRYSLGEPVATNRLGRPATSVTIIENERVRARLVIDDESTIPLLTEIFDGQGRLFRLASLVEFEVGARGDHPPMPTEFGVRNVMRAAASAAHLPVTVAGYRKADSYAAPEGGVQSYYTDGLFSFSVFESSRGAVPVEFRGATQFSVEGEIYRRIVSPTTVWVHWSSPDRSYVLVGDLPPDHLFAVLGALPEPGERGFLVRLWRRWFD